MAGIVAYPTNQMVRPYVIIAAAAHIEALINQMPGMEPAVRRKPGIAPHESIGQEQ
ncbi:MAG: hypothetical protein OHK0050_15260 [Roseiflexaceae bacterium]